MLGRLTGLKVDKSPGPDGMHPRVLKEMSGNSRCVGGYLSKFVGFWGSAGGLETANVTLLFKKGKRQKAGNYRPVS